MSLSRSLLATGQTLSPFRLTSRMARSNPPLSASASASATTSQVRGHRVTERFKEVLEHHRDERLVFDDQDGTLPHGTLRIADPAAAAKPYFMNSVRAFRAASASSCTEKGLGRKATLSMSIDLRSCSSA